ncbi:MAG TPA: XdhC family protein [Thermoleophilaceae bacterium]
MQPKLARRAEELIAERTPFVVATVVRAQRPTSVRPGDSGIVLGDGTIEGFVGGACAETSVRLQALRALETGEALLLRIVPEGDEAAENEGAIVVRNPCLSGGALEIFLEPRLPAPRIAILGTTPIGQAIAAIAQQLGYDAAITAITPADLASDSALVIASHGHEEPEAITAGLAAGVPYIGLVASRRRGAAVIEELRKSGVEHLDRVRTPAGLDIGARTAEEIALSIVAEIVGSRGEHATAEAIGATDPVCGMTVAVSDATPTVEHERRSVYFCCESCRSAFIEAPERYAGARG